MMCVVKTKSVWAKERFIAEGKTRDGVQHRAHIQDKASKTYTLNTSNMIQMMIIVLAFLLSNGLLSNPGSLVFFTDGARDLRSAIQGIFCFLPFKIILDWFHLEKKCKDLLSMAIKGKQAKNQLLACVLAWLWLGKVDQAINVLRALPEDLIKNGTSETT